MAHKVVIPLNGEEVAPRFDLAAEVWIGRLNAEGGLDEERIVVLPQASAEALCHLIVSERAKTVICGGIEELYYDYLVWKKVAVIDSVVGRRAEVFRAFLEGSLESGTVLFERKVRR